MKTMIITTIQELLTILYMMIVIPLAAIPGSIYFLMIELSKFLAQLF